MRFNLVSYQNITRRECGGFTPDGQLTNTTALSLPLLKRRGREESMKDRKKKRLMVEISII